MGTLTEDFDGLKVEHTQPEGDRRSLPIVLVHGLWADAWVWERWLPHAASRGWDAWAVQLRGRQGSRPVADLGKVRIEDFVRDVRDVLQRLGPAIVVGHSMGGLIVQAVAASDERVRAAALVSAIPPRGILAASGPMIRRSPRFLPAILAGRTFAPRRSDAAALICNASPPDVLEQYTARVVADSGTVARQILLGAVRIDPALVRCPAIIVGMGRDRISPPSVHPKLAERYGGDLVMFPDLDHLHVVGPRWRGPADAVLDWADRVAGT